MNREIINAISDSDSSGNIETESEAEERRSASEVSDFEEPAEANNNVGVDIDNDGELMLDIDDANENVIVPNGIVEEVEESDSDSESDADERVVAGPVVLNEEDKERYLIQALREWASSGGVLSMRKVDELLHKLRFAFSNMPKSYKTLLSTVSNLEITVTNEFKFWYKGIAANLNQLILDRYLEVTGCVKIDINMDGLPLFKDSSKDTSKKFWPILGKLVGAEEDPFIIGIYCGDSDPRDIDQYLGDFVVEVNDLKNDGYRYGRVRYEFSIRNFVLDAPARSMIKCCVGHGGYGACEKCTVVGKHVQGRVCYPTLGDDCRARTDESYKNKLDRIHHCGRSPLEFIDVGMVSQFRLDTMHLLYKGAFLRFLEALLTWEGEWNLEADTIADISARLLSYAQSCPRDFNRRPRALVSYYKYKATELRRLLLYDGVVAFKDKLDVEVYKLFLLLHCAIYILASPYLLPLFIDEAELFLKHFVQFSAQMFGEHFAVYNVHSLLHLGQECREHGTLESFSAFPFENFLKTIKQMLRSGYLPLEQIAKRDSERRERREVKMPQVENSAQFFESHTDQNEREPGQQYRRICVNNITFKVGGRDSCFMTSDGVVVQLENIIRREGDSVCFVGKRFMHYDNVYTYPMESSRLGILRVGELSANRELFPLEDVFSKCWLIQDGDSYVSMPLVHSTPLLH